MGEIQTGAGQVVQVMHELSSTLSEQSAASGEISRRLDQIVRMAEDNRDSVAGNAATAAELEQLTSHLQTEIARVKVA